MTKNGSFAIWPTTVRSACLLALLGLVMRKVFIGREAMATVSQFKDQVSTEKMLNNTNFVLTATSLSSMHPTFILILNQHALNMTLNWLCNTEAMPSVHERSLIVTLDAVAYDRLEQLWPNVKRLLWEVPGLSEPFNYGDGKYQLFYLFRANLARALLKFNKPFWMIQQDTFWRKSLLDLEVPTEPKDSVDIVFDRAAETDGSLIAGGYYLAQPTDGARRFFDRLSRDLEWWYAPDNTYMTSLCAEGGLANCSQLPFSTVTNWIWLHEPSRFKSREVPWLVQFDGDTKLGGKLAKMRTLGFYFTESDGHTCTLSAVKRAQERVVRWSGVSGHLDAAGVRAYSHWQFGLYQAAVDLLYRSRPTEWLLHRVVFPYAHYFMITL